MDKRTGEIITREEMSKRIKEGRTKNEFRELAGLQWKAEKKILPNEKCPCKSGKKFKVCCYMKF